MAAAGVQNEEIVFTYSTEQHAKKKIFTQENYKVRSKNFVYNSDVNIGLQ